jgi:hypothetical protein
MCHCSSASVSCNREPCSEFYDHAGGVGMVIPPGEKGSPRGRAKRRRVELRVAQALFC